MQSINQEIDNARIDLFHHFSENQTKSYSSRKHLLSQLKQSLENHTSNIVQSLQSDLNRCEFQAYLCEINNLKNNIDHHLRNLKAWMSKEPLDFPLALMPGSNYVRHEPLGVVLVLGSWNFPFATTLNPVIGALAAGNCVLVKPSEVSQSCSKVIKQILDELPSEVVHCLEGGPEVAQQLLLLRWDLICFTGSSEKGKLVAEAAAKHLTPTILELGGKNPAILDTNVDLEVAVMRILQGRFINCGQICLAPEMALVPFEIVESFLTKCKEVSNEYFGEDPQVSSDLGRMVNEFHTKRVLKLIENSGGEVVLGGTGSVESRYIAPTIILNPDLDSAISKEEVFGPVLLVYTYKTLEECIAFIKEREKPLSMYFFGKDKKVKEQLETETSSGSFSWNDCIVNYSCFDLPFGGTGSSGSSRIFGKYGFIAMSNQKGVMEKSLFNKFPINLRYPPHTLQKFKNIQRLAVSHTKQSLKELLKVLAVLAAVCFLVKKGHLKSLVKVPKAFLKFFNVRI